MMDKKLSRRKFLRIAGGVVGAGVVACGGSAYFGLRTPSSVVYKEDFCEGEKDKKFLFAYSSRSGATGEIAEKIAASICTLGYTADLMRIQNVQSLDVYHAVVIGSPVYMGRVMGDCVSFIEKYEKILYSIPTAFFGVGLTMKVDTQENRSKMREFFSPAIDALNPELVEYFAGQIKLDTLPPLFRIFAQLDSGGVLAEGDYRDWEAISTWGAELKQKMDI